MQRPGKTDGMRHVALLVEDLERSQTFYTSLLGMTVEWRPDDDNVYLTSGNDNLALHRRSGDSRESVLDHIGFFINDISQIDQWYAFLRENHVKMLTEPKTHRDGARSFYCEDPAGTRVQLIYHPPIAAAKAD